MRRIRFAVRALSHTPLLTLVVVLSLGLGIGANTAIFSLLYQMVLRSLPVQEPERLVTLTSPPEFKFGRSSSGNAGGQDMIFSYRVFRALEKNPQGMQRLATRLNTVDEPTRNELVALCFRTAERYSQTPGAATGAVFAQRGSFVVNDR